MHELKNPLTALQGSAELLHGHVASEEGHRLLENLVAQALYRQGMCYMKLKNELEEKFGVSMDYAMLIADDLDEAPQPTRR